MNKEKTLIWADNNIIFKTINKFINWLEGKILRKEIILTNNLKEVKTK